MAQFAITKNRRSTPDIIRTANAFAPSIPGRLPKEMAPFRPATAGGPAVVAWSAEYELDEAGYVANTILDLNEAGVPYRDIAVLVRSRAAYPKLLEQFATFDIPVQPGGRTGLFAQPEARVLGRTIVWLSDLDWREGYGWGTAVDDDLLAELIEVFEVSGPQKRAVRKTLHDWKAATKDQRRTADLIRELYELLEVLDARSWDLTTRSGSTASAPWGGSRRCSPTTSRSADGLGWTRTTPASRWVPATEARGSTGTSAFTSSTTPTVPTKGSMARPMPSLTRLT